MATLDAAALAALINDDSADDAAGAAAIEAAGPRVTLSALSEHRVTVSGDARPRTVAALVDAAASTASSRKRSNRKPRFVRGLLGRICYRVPDTTGTGIIIDRWLATDQVGRELLRAGATGIADRGTLDVTLLRRLPAAAVAGSHVASDLHRTRHDPLAASLAETVSRPAVVWALWCGARMRDGSFGDLLDTLENILARTGEPKRLFAHLEGDTRTDVLDVLRSLASLPADSFAVACTLAGEAEAGRGSLARIVETAALLAA